MTRNDSAQTPYFIPTPQRTDSNWGGDAYINNNSSTSAVVKMNKDMSIKKKANQLHDAI